MSNRNWTLLQLLVDGGKASGYKEDLSIRFGDRKEHCALYFKTLMSQNKEPFMATSTCFSLWICVSLQAQKAWFRVKLTMQKAWFRAILCDKNTCLLGKYRLTYPQLYVNYPKERHEIFVLKPIKNIMYLRCFSIILAFLTKADECFCKRKVLKIEL